jgi:radical SAM superfamily enzyme YgiQ (UPF0313 family)
MSWKRVLALYPYSPTKKSEQLYGGMAIINPIGLEVVATAASRHADVLVVDMRMERRPLADILAEYRPELIMVSMNWGRDEFVDGIMRSLPDEATILLGGIAPTQSPDAYFEAYPNLDMIALGYGEKIVEELLQHGSPVDVRGLVYRRRAKSVSPAVRADRVLPPGEAQIVRNDVHYEIDVAALHVDRSLRRYDYPFLSLKGDNIATSIGCPMVCAFCGWRTNIYGQWQSWIPRSAEDVVNEIAETDADVVHIVDANFGHDIERVEAICDELIRRDIRRLLACEIRVNTLYRSLDLVKKMEQAGFFMFMIGIESTNDAVLKKLKKGYTVKMCRQAFEYLRQTNILTLGNFIIGSPGETEDDMLYVARYARELGLDFISPNKLYAYPNSAFSEWIEEHPGYRIEGRRGYVVSDEMPIERLRKIQRKIYLKFFTPAHVLRFYRKAITHPMVKKLGAERIKRAMLRTLWNHVADANFRRRALKKIFGRFTKKRRRRAATI